MGEIGKPERVTQERVIKLFKDELGYDYLGDWTYRTNGNIDEGMLTAWLERSGYSQAQIQSAQQKLITEAANPNRSPYANNKRVYRLLRYGVDVRIAAGELTETVHLVNWKEPEKNHFAVAEEVTMVGEQERRPDIVLFLNGIAIVVLELKKSTTSLATAISQNISNQMPEFNEWFYATVQFVMAGNDTEGLRYGTIGTPEKHFLTWKEDEETDVRYKLDKYLLKLCRKDRLLELIHDFVVFDAGVKKVPRVHQYFAIKAAQEHVRRQEGGIIWHTQGSGKSLVMVYLARWILENNPNARVAIITDREELDAQIQRVFADVGEEIVRAGSGADLMRRLGDPSARILCSLIHKFKPKDADNFEEYIRELEAKPSPAVGDVFVFVDECHRTQSGRLNTMMKTVLPNAVFIGFTGTPLLKKDKKTSREVFGGYIHVYLFKEAVEDKVILDLVYEARDIDQRLGSQEKIDAWFEAKTQPLNQWQKDELKKKWGTMQKVLSSRSRMEQVIEDIIFDFEVKPRLSQHTGTAILVASSIYEACKYFTLFRKTPFANKCALVTSYTLDKKDVTLEETGADSETDRQFIYNTYKELLEGTVKQGGKNPEEIYIDRAKARFINEPANMKLLIVVDKLLTGFDAPSCTYLYIDKSMRDHGLFQAICRTNRLDGPAKLNGHIVDYKDLFKNVEHALAVYSAELDESATASPNIMLKERLTDGHKRLEDAREAIALLCEPVENPKGEQDYVRYFCGNIEIKTDLKEYEPRRVALYLATVNLLRSYANIADELRAAGYTADDIEVIRKELDHYKTTRDTVRKAAGEELDLKAYEADMHFLLDTYIRAEAPRPISAFDENTGLLELIVKSGIAEAIRNKLANIQHNQDAVAEVIAGNVRSRIIKEELNDPAFYDKMSKLLLQLIKARKERAIEYEDYLKEVAELARKVMDGQAAIAPKKINTPGLHALYNNLNENETLALRIDATLKTNSPDGWREVPSRERSVKHALYEILGDEAEVERIFAIIKHHPEY